MTSEEARVELNKLRKDLEDAVADHKVLLLKYQALVEELISIKQELYEALAEIRRWGKSAGA